MAALALAAAGAAIGSIWGSAAIGWAVGSALGSFLFAPKITQEGPRLGDLKVQTSTYGAPIPICYGSTRIAGNVIWSTDILETRTESSQGGKGGGGATTVNYSYSQSFAVAVCEGQIAGIRKIWANGKLIYNLSDTASIETIAASNSTAVGIRIYTGSETQTADSLIQANIGSADTPAYRGIAYVLFDNLQLADFGNRMPNLEFEVINSGEDALIAGPVTENAFFSGIDYTSITTGLPWVAGSPSSSSAYARSTMTNARITADGSHAYCRPGMIVIDDITYWLQDQWIDNHGAFTQRRRLLVKSSIAVTSYPYIESAAYQPWDREGMVVTQADKLIVVDFANNSESIIPFPGLVRVYISARSGNDLYVGANVGGVFGTYHINGGVPVLLDVGQRFINADVNGWNLCTDTQIISYYHGTTSAYRTIENPVQGSMPTPIYYRGFGRVSDGFMYRTGLGGQYIYHVSDDSVLTYIGVIGDYDFLYLRTFGAFGMGVFVTPGMVAVETIIDAWYGIGIASSTTTTCAAIVSDICLRAGLTAGDIDVTALTDEVHGYVVQRSSARAQIEQLMQAYHFDAVESSGKIKFVKRGMASLLTIPEDDLAAHEYGSEVQDTVTIDRTQEMELPVEVDIQYLGANTAYQVGTQSSQRLTTASENKVSINFAIAMTGEKAKQIADVLMYDAWTGRTRFGFQTGWKYCYLEPTDVISIVKGGRVYTVRITDEDYGMVSDWRAVLEDSAVYTQPAVVVDEGLPPDETVPLVPLTKLMLMDIPLMRDQDDGVGFYAAACSYGSAWNGAQAYKSSDGGATWGSFGSGFLNDATIGSATTVLASFTQNVFDEKNSVTVTLINGELSSDTELNVLNGANVALLGNEIIQFKTATLIAANTYTLTGLLRGRKGTEWATHAVGERFVLLSTASTYIMTGASSEYDLQRHYRGVTLGGFLDDAETIAFTNTAVAQIPLSPVQLGGGRNAAGDITLKWTRRTRIGGGWNSFSDVPLGESSELYVVEIYSNSGYGTVKRTITGLTTPTASYTAAQQTTDFGSPQSTVYWKVYQSSAVVGAGYEARGVT